jgi:hypothetical protein
VTARVPAQRSPLAIAEAARYDAAVELEQAAQALRELPQVGRIPTAADGERYREASRRYDAATAEVLRLCRGGAA